MNMEIFRLINNLAGRNAALDKTMIFFSNDVPYIFMAVTAGLFILGFIRNDKDYRKVSVKTVVFTALNLIINIIIRGIFHVDRPFIHNKVNLLVPHDAASSFPSNHATGTGSIALGLGNYNRLLGVIMAILSIVVGFSRVYVGDHYPMDVIGAYMIVFATSYIYKMKVNNKVEDLYGIVEKKIAMRLGFKNL